MAKKRGKSKGSASFKRHKAGKKSSYRISSSQIASQTPVSAAPAKKTEASEMNSEIDRLLKDEGNIKQELERLEEKEISLEAGEEQLKKGESRIEKQEKTIRQDEKKIEGEAKRILGVEEEIRNNVIIKPLGKVTIMDVNKGLIGAFFGTIAHFAFIYGREIAKGITNTRAAVLYAFSYFLLIFLMYRAGYREIEEKKYLELFPLRATILYLLSICVVIFVFLLYNQIEVITLGVLFREVSVVSILAVLGAGTADMLGRH